MILIPIAVAFVWFIILLFTVAAVCSLSIYLEYVDCYYDLLLSKVLYDVIITSNISINIIKYLK
jgi:hypothetical protein